MVTRQAQRNTQRQYRKETKLYNGERSTPCLGRPQIPYHPGAKIGKGLAAGRSWTTYQESMWVTIPRDYLLRPVSVQLSTEEALLNSCCWIYSQKLSCHSEKKRREEKSWNDTFLFFYLYFYYCSTEGTLWHLSTCLQYIIVEFTSIILLYLPPPQFLEQFQQVSFLWQIFKSEKLLHSPGNY
jgi:hypothetical protein